MRKKEKKMNERKNVKREKLKMRFNQLLIEKHDNLMNSINH